MAFDSVASKLDLQETGTRYDHYMELKEVFLLGIDVIDRMRESYVSDTDKLVKKNLQTAVDMIEKRLAYLANFSTEASQYSDFGRELNAIKPHVTPKLTAGSPNDSQSSNSTPQQNPNRPSTQEDSGGETAVA
jgi:hypothetical protein